MFIDPKAIVTRIADTIQGNYYSVKDLPKNCPQDIPPSIRSDIDFQIKRALLVEKCTQAHPAYLEELDKLRDSTHREIDRIYDNIVIDTKAAQNTTASPQAIQTLMRELTAFVTQRIAEMKTYDLDGNVVKKVNAPSTIPRRKTVVQPSINPFLSLLPPELRRQVEEIIAQKGR